MRDEPPWLGLVPLLKRDPQNSLVPPSHENTAIYQPGSRPSPDTESSGSLILDYPASRMVRSKCLVLKLLRLWYSVVSSLN